jgi:predicted transcriptional regulator
MVRAARRRRGLSQRALAAAAGVPQSTVARIESATLDPRVTTLERILRAADHGLTAGPRLGVGVDRSQIRERLRLSPRQRIDEVVAAAAAVEPLRTRARRRRR